MVHGARIPDPPKGFGLLETSWGKRIEKTNFNLMIQLLLSQKKDYPAILCDLFGMLK